MELTLNQLRELSASAENYQKIIKALNVPVEDARKILSNAGYQKLGKDNWEAAIASLITYRMKSYVAINAYQASQIGPCPICGGKRMFDKRYRGMRLFYFICERDIPGSVRHSVQFAVSELQKKLSPRLETVGETT